MRYTSFSAFFLTLGTITTVDAKIENAIVPGFRIDLSREPNPVVYDAPASSVQECFWFMFYNGQRVDAGACHSDWSFGLQVGKRFVQIKTDKKCNLHGTYAPGWIVLGRERDDLNNNQNQRIQGKTITTREGN